MVRYFYDFTPLVFIGTLCILALPWLGLIALLVAVLVVLLVASALTWAIVYVPYKLVRAAGHHWHGHDGEAAVSPGHTS